MSKAKSFFSPKNLTIMAMLIALQIVLARFVGIQVSEGLRVSFETVPIMIAGLWLGPVAGLIVAFLSDFLGTIISGYGAYFVPLAITPILNGVLPSLAFRFIWKNDVNIWKCVLTVIVTELISSIICGTYVLTWYYALFVPSKQATFSLLLVTRLPKLATIAVDTVLVTLVHCTMYKRVAGQLLTSRK